ncbi:hypothetical protein PR048_000673 [Dryococelus australis]|uniref:Uncharacterized protein n=1 Tax=Dryococelus australis TaxID=614101 RepID=A0ABQ9IFW1_9NEOP|nr:hypothetical protein PR048_000673 [Dryococelus australis]
MESTFVARDFHRTSQPRQPPLYYGAGQKSNSHNQVSSEGYRNPRVNMLGINKDYDNPWDYNTDGRHFGYDNSKRGRRFSPDYRRRNRGRNRDIKNTSVPPLPNTYVHLNRDIYVLPANMSNGIRSQPDSPTGSNMAPTTVMNWPVENNNIWQHNFRPVQVTDSATNTPHGYFQKNEGLNSLVPALPPPKISEHARNSLGGGQALVEVLTGQRMTSLVEGLNTTPKLDVYAAEDDPEDIHSELNDLAGDENLYAKTWLGKVKEAAGIAERRMECARVCEAELVASCRHQTALGRTSSWIILWLLRKDGMTEIDNCQKESRQGKGFSPNFEEMKMYEDPRAANGDVRRRKVLKLPVVQSFRTEGGGLEGFRDFPATCCFLLLLSKVALALCGKDECSDHCTTADNCGECRKISRTLNGHAHVDIIWAFGDQKYGLFQNISEYSSEYGAASERGDGGKREISEKTRGPATSSDASPTCENPHRHTKHLADPQPQSTYRCRTLLATEHGEREVRQRRAEEEAIGWRPRKLLFPYKREGSCGGPAQQHSNIGSFGQGVDDQKTHPEVTSTQGTACPWVAGLLVLIPIQADIIYVRSRTRTTTYPLHGIRRTRRSFGRSDLSQWRDRSKYLLQQRKLGHVGRLLSARLGVVTSLRIQLPSDQVGKMLDGFSFHQRFEDWTGSKIYLMFDGLSQSESCTTKMNVKKIKNNEQLTRIRKRTSAYALYDKNLVFLIDKILGRVMSLAGQRHSPSPNIEHCQHDDRERHGKCLSLEHRLANQCYEMFVYHDRHYALGILPNYLEGADRLR